MTPHNQTKAARQMDIHEQCNAALEEILDQKLDELATVLSVSGNGKSRLHADIVDMVEKSLFKIALRRSGHVKSAAAAFLGINRNTFSDKMTKLGLEQKKQK
ncbi:MAG TPA: helix-turn-helix domain-containing protein [Smithellaceae bacterium]|nr:helix-turn-helix domain-containing protein [Smithellaceae bacterium]HQF84543.1 helix-turn-helix domain-containing protein [Smithellaceae bacterium]HQG80875.1 helix-turn-helix domain-containing protein [Smithellaceae bacterium]